ncbi:MAG: hypothetical protein RJS97_18305 [Parvibaculaceae bacterium]
MAWALAVEKATQAHPSKHRQLQATENTQRSHHLASMSADYTNAQSFSAKPPSNLDCRRLSITEIEQEPTALLRLQLIPTHRCIQTTTK